MPLVRDLYLTDFRAVLIVDDKDVEAVLTMLHYIRGGNQDVGSDAGLLPGVDEIALIDQAKPARPEIGDRHASDAMLARSGRGNSSWGRPRILMGQGGCSSWVSTPWGCLRSLRARSALDGVSWVQGG